MELKAAMQLRASCRAYQAQQITDAQLDAILDAAYLAPVGMGAFDDVKLVVVQDGAKLDRLNELAALSAGDPDMRPTYGAPTLVYVCLKEGMDDLLAGANAGCIMENMMLAAADEGLGSVYLFGVCRMLEGNEEAAGIIGVPEGYRPISAAAVGIPAEAPAARTPDSSKIQTTR